MADTTYVKWVYPPNWDENPPEKSGWRTITVQLIANYGSATGGETDVKKIDLSELRTPTGAVPSKFVVERIDYMVADTTLNVLLEFDRAPHEQFARLSGSGSIDYTRSGGLVDIGGGGTGDILLTTTGAADTDGYDITIRARLKE